MRSWADSECANPKLDHFSHHTTFTILLYVHFLIYFYIFVSLLSPYFFRKAYVLDGF